MGMDMASMVGDVIPELVLLSGAVAVLLLALVLPPSRQAWVAGPALIALVVAAIVTLALLGGVDRLTFAGTYAVDTAAAVGQADHPRGDSRRRPPLGTVVPPGSAPRRVLRAAAPRSAGRHPHGRSHGPQGGPGRDPAFLRHRVRPGGLSPALLALVRGRHQVLPRRRPVQHGGAAGGRPAVRAGRQHDARRDRRWPCGGRPRHRAGPRRRTRPAARGARLQGRRGTGPQLGPRRRAGCAGSRGRLHHGHPEGRCVPVPRATRGGVARGRRVAAAHRARGRGHDDARQPRVLVAGRCAPYPGLVRRLADGIRADGHRGSGGLTAGVASAALLPGRLRGREHRRLRRDRRVARADGAVPTSTGSGGHVPGCWARSR